MPYPTAPPELAQLFPKEEQLAAAVAAAVPPATATPPPAANTEPPAYTPSAVHPLYARLYDIIGQPSMSLITTDRPRVHLSHAPVAHIIPRNGNDYGDINNLNFTDGNGTPGNLVFDEIEDEYDMEDCERLSPINIRINAGVRVSSDDNLVAVTATPEENVCRITEAVLSAFREASAGNCGVPMIDEWGRPRPVRIEVDAAVDVHGRGNVIGPEAVVVETLRRQRLELWRRVREEEQTQRQAEEAEPRRPRRVLADEEPEGPATRAKRARSV